MSNQINRPLSDFIIQKLFSYDINLEACNYMDLIYIIHGLAFKLPESINTYIPDNKYHRIEDIPHSDLQTLIEIIDNMVDDLR